MNRRLPSLLLLLTVWLHTVLNVPWHHAQHVAELWPHATSVATTDKHTESPQGTEDHAPEEAHHSPCAWCTVLAHAALGTSSLPSPAALLTPTALPVPCLLIGQGRQAWRLAWARAPPSST